MIFVFYHGARIYLLEATKPAPREGAEVYHYTHQDGSSLSIIFLPKYRVIITYENQDYFCFQLYKQTNKVGRRVFGDVYYLEDSGVFFDYLRAPEDYKPILYKLKTVSIVGTCDEFPQIGTETNLVLFHRDKSLLYYGNELFRQYTSDMEVIEELLNLF